MKRTKKRPTYPLYIPNQKINLLHLHIQKLTIFVLSNNRIQLVKYYGKSRNKGRPLYVYYLNKRFNK